jgi:DNA repair protein RadA/Sms
VALAIVSAHRGEALPARLGAFGELGLTGRLRPVSHVSARLGEASKLGVQEVVAPSGNSAAGVRVREADTLSAAISAAFA